MRRTVLVALAAMLFLSAALCLALPRIPTLILENERGRTLARIPCADGTFVHRYVHSIHLRDVDEEYGIEPDGMLHLTASRFDTLGVGIPYDADEGFSLEKGRFLLKMDRRYRSLPIRVSPIPGHLIIAGGHLYALSDWFAPGDLVVLSARNLPRLFAGTAPTRTQ